ncbi:YdeI/OmpD-associated family protein [Pseudocnuella soli]|uniref:YdeI/OmpD-associated family protein n=1 Tax=Pseudocnuella soli TaxID=2502779 RepID=UPI0010497403|nr:YdeI/OmpD-associated family protein [Pseudocnuella soli]
MIHFTTLLKKFEQMGEKSGWTYFEVPAAIAEQLNPGVKKAYRVRGKMDRHPFAGVALVPMGGGDFIFAVNATMRKAIKKLQGETVKLIMELDPELPKVSTMLLECLQDEPEAKAYFFSLAQSHQLYFTRWIDSAKTDSTKTKRVAETINALVLKKDFGQMIRDGKRDRDLLGIK